MRLLTLALIALSLLNCQQTGTPLPDRTINCEETFDQLTSKIEANYIALKEMEAAGEKWSFDEHVKRYADLVKGQKGSECTKVLTGFINWFDDGHLFVIERPEYTDVEKAILREEVTQKKKGKEKLEELLNRTDKDLLTGKWTDGNYLYGIIKDKNTYTAYAFTSSDTVDIGYPILNLKTRDSGFEGLYRGYSNKPRYITANLYKDNTLLSIFGGINWKKVTAGSLEETDIGNGLVVNPDLGKIEKITEDIVLFEIPSFNVDFSQFRDLILENEQLLRNTEYLIIDVRGNTGGNALFGMFTGLYADRGREASQGKVLASEDNKEYFKRFASRNPDVYQPVVDRINENMGEIVGGPVFPARPYQEEENIIKKVAILTDEACASACESFLLNSKRISDRVVHYGTPTFGMIDYTSVNMVPLKSGNQNILFGYPTGKLSETWLTTEYPNGYNESGIKPDVTISASHEDEIQFVIEHLSNK